MNPPCPQPELRSVALSSAPSLKASLYHASSLRSAMHPQLQSDQLAMEEPHSAVMLLRLNWDDVCGVYIYMYIYIYTSPLTYWPSARSQRQTPRVQTKPRAPSAQSTESPAEDLDAVQWPAQALGGEVQRRQGVLRDAFARGHPWRSGGLGVWGGETCAGWMDWLLVGGRGVKPQKGRERGRTKEQFQKTIDTCDRLFWIDSK